jgi:hypothetical protein
MYGGKTVDIASGCAKQKDLFACNQKGKEVFIVDSGLKNVQSPVPM